MKHGNSLISMSLFKLTKWSIMDIDVWIDKLIVGAWEFMVDPGCLGDQES